jgi:hypothetical protein
LLKCSNSSKIITNNGINNSIIGYTIHNYIFNLEVLYNFSISDNNINKDILVDQLSKYSVEYTNNLLYYDNNKLILKLKKITYNDLLNKIIEYITDYLSDPPIIIEIIDSNKIKLNKLVGFNYINDYIYIADNNNISYGHFYLILDIDYDTLIITLNSNGIINVGYIAIGSKIGLYYYLNYDVNQYTIISDIEIRRAYLMLLFNTDLCSYYDNLDYYVIRENKSNDIIKIDYFSVENPNFNYIINIASEYKITDLNLLKTIFTNVFTYDNELHTIIAIRNKIIMAIYNNSLSYKRYINESIFINIIYKLISPINISSYQLYDWINMNNLLKLDEEVSNKYSYKEYSYIKYISIVKPISHKKIYKLLLPNINNPASRYPYKTWNINTKHNLENYLLYITSTYENSIIDIYNNFYKIYNSYIDLSIEQKETIINYYLNFFTLKKVYYKTLFTTMYINYLNLTELILFDINTGFTFSDNKTFYNYHIFLTFNDKINLIFYWLIRFILYKYIDINLNQVKLYNTYYDHDSIDDIQSFNIFEISNNSLFTILLNELNSYNDYSNLISPNYVIRFTNIKTFIQTSTWLSSIFELKYLFFDKLEDEYYLTWLLYKILKKNYNISLDISVYLGNYFYIKDNSIIKGTYTIEQLEYLKDILSRDIFDYRDIFIGSINNISKIYLFNCSKLNTFTINTLGNIFNLYDTYTYLTYIIAILQSPEKGILRKYFIINNNIINFDPIAYENTDTIIYEEVPTIYVINGLLTRVLTLPKYLEYSYDSINGYYIKFIELSNGYTVALEAIKIALIARDNLFLNTYNNLMTERYYNLPSCIALFTNIISSMLNIELILINTYELNNFLLTLINSNTYIKTILKSLFFINLSETSDYYLINYISKIIKNTDIPFINNNNLNNYEVIKEYLNIFNNLSTKFNSLCNQSIIKIEEINSFITYIIGDYTIDKPKPAFGNYIDFLGLNIIKNIKLQSDVITIDEITNDYMFIYKDMFISDSKLDGYYKMIGMTEDLILAGNRKVEKILYIPIPFYFINRPGLALPLISLLHSNIKLNIKLLDYNKLFEFCYNGTIEDNLFTCKLDYIFDYIFLDDEEREKFASYRHEYLVEQKLYKLVNIIDYTDIKLKFNNCVKDIFWFINTIDNYNKNQFNNYTSKDRNNNYKLLGNDKRINKLVSLDIITDINYRKEQLRQLYSDNNNITLLDTCYLKKIIELNLKDYKLIYDGNSVITNSEFIINGKRLFRGDSIFLSSLMTHKHNIRKLSNGIQYYSFALNPLKFQPSGSINMSQLNDIKLKLEISDKGLLKVIVRSYNILRIMSGKIGFAFI